MEESMIPQTQFYHKPPYNKNVTVNYCATNKLKLLEGLLQCR